MVDQDSRQTTAGPELEEAVERQIVRRTWGRVHQLHVESLAGHVVVHGCAPTYYVKQLALSAVQELCFSVPVDLDIQVGDSNSSPR